MTLGKTWNLALPHSSRLGDEGRNGPHLGAVVRGDTSGHMKLLRLCLAHQQNTGRVSHHQRAPGLTGSGTLGRFPNPRLRSSTIKWARWWPCFIF